MEKPSQYQDVSERQHQRTLFQWWRYVGYRKYRLPLNALYKNVNEGKRSIVLGAQLKEEGLRKGLPDITLAVPRNHYGALYIELKTLKGKATKAQLDFISDLKKCGNAAHICYGWEEAKQCIEDYLDGMEVSCDKK